MSDASTAESANPGLVPTTGHACGLETLKASSGWFVALGVVLIVVGTLAVGSSFVATLATVFAFGSLLLVGAAAQIVGAFFSRKWSGFFLELLAGILYLIVGLLMLAHPAAVAAGLTLMLAVFFLVGGITRVVVALAERFDGWPWLLTSGVITALLGLLIWTQWPLSGLWVIGLFVGIELIFCGWSWVMLGLAARGVAKQVG